VAVGNKSRKHQKAQAMTLQTREMIVQQITDDFDHATESRKDRVLLGWRVTLANEPHLCQPFQIDDIVREVREKRTSSSLQTTGSSAS
jgi:hypothetical protein